MAWRRPQAPRTPEEREAAYQRGLELQANVYGVPAEGIATRGRRGRRQREGDELGETAVGLLELVDVHPVASVIIMALLPVLAVAWLIRRIRR